MTTTQRFTIHGRLDGLNEYTKECRSNKYSGNKIKRANQAIVIEAAKNARLKIVKAPVKIRYLWVERDRRRDLDNVCFAQKFVQDALVEIGILPGDGPAWVVGMVHNFAVDKKNPRIEIEIVEVEIK